MPLFNLAAFFVCVCVCLSTRVDEDEEIIVKAMTDYWVVGKKSDQRELYVILNQKNANLIEVNGMSPSPGNVLIIVIVTTVDISGLMLN